MFAAATATYGQKADERGDDARELGKIVERIEKGDDKADPFKPDGEDETGIAPGQMLDKRLTDLLTDCKASLATVEDEATKRTHRILPDMRE
jgi:hypothetical protein